VIENVDRHVLAGFRCMDAITGLSVLDPLQVMAAPLVLRRNLSGVFAVFDAPGVDRNATQLLEPDPASWPGSAKYEVRIEDPANRYLPRRAIILAPQPLPPEVAVATTTTTTTTTTTSTTTTVPAVPAQPPLLTVPQQVVLYPGPAAPVDPNWAVIRVSAVSNDISPKRLPWTVIQVTGIPGMKPVGLTNKLGEALLAVPGLGLKLSSSATGSVTEATTAATVMAWFDPSALQQPPDWVSNPDRILQDLSNTQWKTASQAVQLAPGQTSFVRLSISV
jgi:hypothetical protein